MKFGGAGSDGDGGAGRDGDGGAGAEAAVIMEVVAMPLALALPEALVCPLLVVEAGGVGD